MLLFGDPKFSENINTDITYAVIKFIKSTDRFSGSIYDQYNSKHFLFPFFFLSFFYFSS